VMKAVRINSHGGLYVNGVSFSDTKYLELVSKYTQLVNSGGVISAMEFAVREHVSITTARKVADMAKGGSIVIKPCGRPTRGIGSSYGFTEDHHTLIYSLYLENPTRSLEDYCVQFYDTTGINVSKSFMSRWFSSIGPYKGRMRYTSIFPPKKFSEENYLLLDEYLTFISGVDHKRLVFADEKPMSESETYAAVRRDPFTGHVPHNVYDNVNARHRYNILAATCLKEDVARNVEAVVLDVVGDSTVFQEFVGHLLNLRFLREGDIFIVDNCSIHMQGENEFLMEHLWDEHDIAMIPLPPYTPELNPTELVFNALVARLKATRSRSTVTPGHAFACWIQEELDSMSRSDVKNFYKHMGYIA